MHGFDRPAHVGLVTIACLQRNFGERHGGVSQEIRGEMDAVRSNESGGRDAHDSLEIAAELRAAELRCVGEFSDGHTAKASLPQAR